MSKTLFISSTCYDLGPVRQEIEEWAKAAGMTPLLSDRANFPVDPTLHRHDVCLSNAMGSTMMVLVVASRFGAPYYKEPSISITWAEFRAARRNSVPVMAFVDSRVWDDRYAYAKDPTQPLAFCQDPRTFEFLSEIQRDPAGVWLCQYGSSSEIVQQLRSLTYLVGAPNVLEGGDSVKRNGRYLIVSSLANEVQHLVRLLIGDVEEIGEGDLLQCLNEIPEDVEVREYCEPLLHGFCLMIRRDDRSAEPRFLVRPSNLGSALREECLHLLTLL